MIANGSSLQELMGPRRGKINPAGAASQCPIGLRLVKAAVT
jgi:hypothetical protein